MEDDEMNLENEEVLEQDEELEEDEDVIELDDITEEDEDANADDDEQEDNEEQEDDETDYKALYEAEQKKRKDLQSALNSERKQRKQSVKKSDITATSTYKDLVAKGIDSDVAEAIAKSVEKRSEETTSQIEDLKFEAAMIKASKKTGFEDIEDYAEDIRPFVDKGLSIEQAYYVAVGEKGKTNTKAEIERQIEAKMKNQKAKSKIQKIDTTGGSGSIKTKETYSAMDIKMAKAFGMSPKEYADYKNINSEKDYQKMKSKNKK